MNRQRATDNVLSRCVRALLYLALPLLAFDGVLLIVALSGWMWCSLALFFVLALYLALAYPGFWRLTLCHHGMPYLHQGRIKQGELHAKLCEIEAAGHGDEVAVVRKFAVAWTIISSVELLYGPAMWLLAGHRCAS